MQIAWHLRFTMSFHPITHDIAFLPLPLASLVPRDLVYICGMMHHELPPIQVK